MPLARNGARRAPTPAQQARGKAMSRPPAPPTQPRKQRQRKNRGKKTKSRNTKGPVNAHTDAFASTRPFPEVMASGRSTNVPLYTAFVMSTPTADPQDARILTFTQCYGQSAAVAYNSVNGVFAITPQTFSTITADPPEDLALGSVSLRLTNMTKTLDVAGSVFALMINTPWEIPATNGDVQALKNFIMDHPRARFYSGHELLRTHQWDLYNIDQRKAEGYYPYDPSLCWSNAAEGAWSSTLFLVFLYTSDINQYRARIRANRPMRFLANSVLNHLATPRPLISSAVVNSTRQHHENRMSAAKVVSAVSEGVKTAVGVAHLAASVGELASALG